MMNLLLLVGICLNVINAEKIPIDDVPWKVSFTGRSYENGRTTFSYHINVLTVGGTDLAAWQIALPDCPEVVVVDTTPTVPHDFTIDPKSGVKGLEWKTHVASGMERDFKLTVEGHIDSESMQYVVFGPGDDNSDYGVGTISGPACAVIPDAICDAGGSYNAYCVHHTILVSLTSTSQQVKSQEWSVSDSSLSLDSPTSINPLLTINPLSLKYDTKSCSAEFDVSLKVHGYDGSSTCVATVSVSDTDAPQFLGLYADDVIVESDDVPASPEVWAVDNCDSDVVVSSKEVLLGSDPASYKLVRTWTATDRCHNKAEHSQTITIQDTTDPELRGVEESTTVECDSVPPPCEVDAYDYNAVTVTYAQGKYDDPSRGCDGYHKLVRTWVATDEAGNKNTATQTIVVQDTQAPIISGVPDHETVECDQVPAAPSLLSLDSCGDSTLSFDEQQEEVGTANDYLLIRTWSAYDLCGNSDSHIQTITVRDTVNPVLSGVDPDATVLCYEIPEPCIVTVIDNCDDTLNVVYNEVKEIKTCADHFQLVRTWTTTDVSGNAVSETQNILIRDLSPPKFAGLPPSQLTVECSDIPDFIVDASDKCDPDVDVVMTQQVSDVVSRISENEYNIYRYWTVVDRCGNQAKHTQQLVVVDTVAPILEGVPHDIEVSCNSVPLLENSYVTVSDKCNCQTGLEVTAAEVRHNGACSDSYTLVRTWSSADCAGNPVEEIQTIIVTDSESPVMTGLPGDQQVQCNNIPAMADVEVSDNCDDSVVVVETTNTLTGSCPYEYGLVRSWSAADVCGNSISHDQHIAVKDTGLPYFDNPANGQSHNFECAGDPMETMGLESSDFVHPTATDACDTNVDVQFTDTKNVGLCQNDITIIREYTATDDCGNSVSEVQTFSVVDTTPPQLVSDFDDDITVEFPNESDTPHVEAVDACIGSTHIETSEHREEWPPCPERSKKIIRTWMATDACGNVSPILRQVITILDTTEPTLSTVPDDVTVNCHEIPPSATLTAEDLGGGDVTIVMSSANSDEDCAHSYVITRTWVATDLCGNANSVEQQVVVVDDQAPILSGVPDDITTECEMPEDPTVTITDECDQSVTVGDPKVVQVEVTDTAEVQFIVTKTWTAIDSCDNSVSKSQVITIKDTFDPEIQDVPDAVTIECSDDLGDIPVLEAIDGCDDDVQITTDIKSFPVDVCEDFVVYHRIWIAEDDEGHQVTATQVVYVKDTVGPEYVNIPADSTIQCSESLTDPEVDVRDACDPSVDEPTLEKSEQHLENSPQYEYKVIYEFVATDRCGNENTLQVDVTVTDTVKPTFDDFSSTVELTCEENIEDQPLVTATDDCYEVTPTKEDEKTEICTDSYTIVRTWTVTDGSGNAATTTQTFIFTDDERPVLDSFAAEITVSYQDIPGYPDISATDNCADVTPVWTQERDAENCDNSYRLKYIATVEDNCGQSATAVQFVNVEDKIPPVIAPQYPDVTVECDALDSLDSMDSVQTDDDASLVIDPIVEEGYDCDHSYTMRRKWVATDDCGNKASWTQTVNVVDTTKPEFESSPEDTTYDCTNENPPQLQVTDNCAEDQLISPSVTRINDPNPTNYQLVVSWSYSDGCGNSANKEQTITVIDLTDPIISSVPSATTVSYTSIPIGNADIVTCTDECGSATSSYTTESIEGSCENHYSLVRSWTCTDLAGNTATEEITLVVEDLEPFYFLDYPDNMEIGWKVGLPGSEPTPQVNTNKDGIDVVYEEVTDADPDSNELNPDLEFNIYRTWTATDVCNNIITQTQTIVITPPPKPQPVPVPPDVHISCADIGLYIGTKPNRLDDETQTIMENVPVENTLAMNTATEAGSCDNEYMVIVTWTAEDLAMQSVSGDMTIFVTDTVLPTWVQEPVAHVVAECEAPAAPTLDVNDNCAADVVPDTPDGHGDASGSIIPVFTETQDGDDLVRTWTAEDACGNSITTVQRVQIADITKPELSVTAPVDVTVDCNGIPNQAVLTASDNCDGSVDVTPTSDGTPDPCDYVHVYKWSATDNSGNVVEDSQTITVVDNESPVFTSVPMPSDIVVECTAIPEVVSLVGTDNCGVPRYNIIETSENTDCTPYKIFRTWTITDECGLASTHVQTVEVQDSTLPELSGILADVTLECNDLAVPSNVQVTEDCDVIDPFFTPQESIETGSCNEASIVHRVWTVTDCTGNVLDALTSTRDITYVDTEPPTITGLSENNRVITVVCPSTEAPTPALSVSDNCDDNVQLSGPVEETIETTNAYNYVVKLTWTASDSCGNSVSDVQTVIFQDVTDPTIVCASSPVEVACNDISDGTPAESFLNHPVAEDSCTTPVITGPTHKDTVNRECQGTYQEVYTWTATDGSGLSVSCDETISVIDDAAPYFEILPEDITIQCGDDVPNADTVSIVDACYDDVSYSKSENSEAGECHDEYTLYRTWDVSDDCGHSTNHMQAIFVQDSVSPILSGVPSEESFSCESVPTPSNHGVTATDNCDTAVSVLFEFEVTSVECEDGTYTYSLSWSAEDRCGNFVDAGSEVDVYDDVSPTLHTVPADTTVDCGSVPEVEDITVKDNCHADKLAVFHSERADGPSPYEYQLTRTWGGSDPCGNSLHASQKITVTDNINPVFNYIPVDQTYSCEAPYIVGELNAVDNCGSVTVEKDGPNEHFGTCDDEHKLVTTWTAFDEAGNLVSVTQTLFFEDTEAPELQSEPENFATECDSVPDALPLHATDNCALNMGAIEATSSIIDQTTDTDYTKVYTWEAVDNCGNKDTHQQSVFVTDSKKPVFNMEQPSNLDVLCNNVPDPDVITATDNCVDSIGVVYEQGRSDGNCPHEYVLTRTWTATDASGNEQKAIQQIKVSDDVPPNLSPQPADVTTQCDSPIKVPTVVAEDLCSDGTTVAFTETKINGDDDYTYQLVRTWSAEDECGNKAEHSQTVQVHDNVAPTVQGNANTVVEIGNVPVPGSATVTDNCDTTIPPTIDCVENKVESDTCLYNYTLVYTCPVSDVSGNFAEHIYTVTVQDTLAPIFYFEGEAPGVAPSTVTVEYGEEPSIDDSLMGLVAVDNSEHEIDLNLPTEKRIDVSNNGHAFTIVWTYLACDDCGNCAEIDRTIVVRDTTPPCLSEEPPSEDVECDNIPPPCEVTTVGEDLTVTTDHSEIFTVNGQKYITRTWSATDASSNSISHTQTLHVVDNSPPVFSRYPESETVSCSCDSFPLAPTVNAIDNCDFSVSVIFTEDKLPGMSNDSYALERVWSAQDNSGKSVSHKQVITVEDVVSPVLSKKPEDRFVECDSIPDAPNLYIKDDCDPDVKVNYEQTTLPGPCDHEYSIQRRWGGQDRTGNSVSYAQNIGVRDTQAPVFEASESECILPNKQYKEYDTTSMFSVADNCASNLEFHIIACNSTNSQASSSFDVTCHFDMQRSILSIYADVNDDEVDGRTYSVYAVSTDRCNNQAYHVREFWIPFTVEDAAMEGLVCEVADVDNLVDNPYE